MNGFELHALMWILSVNQLKFSQPELLEIIDLRQKLLDAALEDDKKRFMLERLLMQRSIRFSKRTVASARSLVSRIVELHPDRFSSKALFVRSFYWLFTSLVSFSVMIYSARSLSSEPGNPAAAILFLIGFGSLVPASTLLRVGFLSRRLTREESPKNA